MSKKNLKAGFTLWEVALVISILGFLYLTVFNKTEGAEAGIKSSIVQDDINEIFNAVGKAKVSATIGKGSYKDIHMDDIARYLPKSMKLTGTGVTSSVTSLNPEIGNLITYQIAHADATGTKFKLLLNASKFKTSKSLDNSKVTLLETNAHDTIVSRAGSAVIKNDATAIGSAGSDFSENTTVDYDGIVGFGNISF